MEPDHFVTANLLDVEMNKCRDGLKNELTSWLDRHEKAEFEKHDHIDRSLQDLTVSVSMLTEAFQQGKGAVNLLKWLAIIVTGAWAILIWAKDHLRL